MSTWLAERARCTPGAAAIASGGRVLTWRGLAARASRLAGALAARGIRPGEVVALDAAGVDFAEAFHAADACGAVLLPVNARLTPAEASFQLRDAGARVLLFGDGPAADRAAALRGVGTLSLRSLAGEPRSTPPCPAATDPDATFAIVYTSGTSGAPRGVALTRRCLTAGARASAEHLGVHPRERWLLCMPLFHVGGLAILVRSAGSGFPVVAHPRFDAEAVSRALDEDPVTLVSLVPTMLDRLLALRGGRPTPPALRAVLVGGAAAPDPLLERAAARGMPVLPTYGLTEAASQVATCPLARAAAPRGAGLVPLPGTRVRVAGGTGRDGEILVQGPTLMRGYVGRPRETARALRDGWLHTGDLGWLDAGGALHVAGRLGDRIVSGGENIDPAEVEAALMAHPQVRDAGVAPVPDGAFGERPAAWIVPWGECAPGATELERFCRARLAGYKIPVAFEFVRALPRTSSGKLLRRKLAGSGPTL